MDDASHGVDITPILENWDYKSDEVTVRKILGLDGKPKIQMRLPMGLIQMELEGRPDGFRPEGFESWLEYYEARHQANPNNFSLDGGASSRLRDEATMYYHRYLSLYHLREFEGVVRDTTRNLHVLDFMKRHAEDPSDRVSMEQYRPYIVMMNTRARAQISLDRQLRGRALQEVRDGIGKIENFLRELGREELISRSPELAILRQLETEIKEHVPEAKIEDLRHEMQKAVAAEDYERAAELRDEIRRLESKT